MFFFLFDCFVNRFRIKTMEYELFQAFERTEYIHIEDLLFVTNYVCGNLNSDY